jgi:drug/metabolite transporter (DMT)-like permease
MGLLNGAIPYTLISWGEIYIDSALAAILNALMPVFTVVLAHFMTRDERFTVRKAVGVGLGLAGVVVLMGPAALMGLGTSVLAQLAVTGAAVCYSVAAIYGKALSKTSSLILATGQMIGASAIMLPFSLVLEKPWTLSPSLLSTVSLTCLSVFGTALAYIFYYRLLGQIGATNLSLVTYLIPLTGVFLGVLVLGERLHWTAFAALGLILSSVAVAGGFADPTSKIGKSSSTFQVKPADNKLDS